MSDLEGRLWQRLALAYEKLLVCYRIGKQPTDKLLNEISKANSELEQFSTKEGG